MKMCEETRRSRVVGGFEVIFSYGEEFLSLNEMLERQEILRYLRRNEWEPSRDALRRRLMKGLRSGSVTKEAVTEYARSTEPIPAPRTKPVTTPVVKPVPLPRTLKSLMRPTPASSKDKTSSDIEKGAKDDETYPASKDTKNETCSSTKNEKC